jgi:protocatechuate 3,4-dioxygenase beta subunit
MDTRRQFLSRTGLILGAFGLAGKALANTCDFRPTPKQPLGPFYPVSFPSDSDIDLTRLGNSAQRAVGDVYIVEGVVTDDMCQPIQGAIVEIWQACHTGKYNHPSDTSDNQLDPNFQYYGMMKTDAQGRYRFKTIKPGAYDASETWRRPPHIHFKVGLRGYRQLVTQTYWEGEALNNKDEILMALPLEERRKVVLTFDEKSVGRFDITLKKIP